MRTGMEIIIDLTTNPLHRLTDPTPNRLMVMRIRFDQTNGPVHRLKHLINSLLVEDSQIMGTFHFNLVHIDLYRSTSITMSK